MAKMAIYGHMVIGPYATNMGKRGIPGRRLRRHRRDIMNRDESKVVARHFMQTNSTVDDIIFVPIKIVRRKNLWARLEIERKFLNDNNLLDDGININL